MHRADLRLATLSRADLRGIWLTIVDLRGAQYDATTKWLEGFDPEAAGAMFVEE